MVGPLAKRGVDDGMIQMGVEVRTHWHEESLDWVNYRDNIGIRLRVKYISERAG